MGSRVVSCASKPKRGRKQQCKKKGHGQKADGPVMSESVTDAIVDSLCNGEAYYMGQRFIWGHWEGEFPYESDDDIYDWNTCSEKALGHQQKYASPSRSVRVRRYPSKRVAGTATRRLRLRRSPRDTPQSASSEQQPSADLTNRHRLFPVQDGVENATSNRPAASTPAAAQAPTSDASTTPAEANTSQEPEVAVPLHAAGAPAPARTGSRRPVAQAASPSRSTGPGGSRPAAPRPTGPVHVLWDLDNKYPLVLDHTRVVSNLRQALRRFGRVAELRAYCNYHTLNHVPELWEAAMQEGIPHPLDPEEPGELRCPLCGRRCSDQAQLAQHLKQLHEREHKKRMNHNPKVKKYMKTGKYERYQAAVREVRPRRRGFDLEGILRAAGVAVTPVQMGPQRADVALERGGAGGCVRLGPPRSPFLRLRGDGRPALAAGAVCRVGRPRLRVVAGAVRVARLGHGRGVEQRLQERRRAHQLG